MQNFCHYYCIKISTATNSLLILTIKPFPLVNHTKKESTVCAWKHNFVCSNIQFTKCENCAWVSTADCNHTIQCNQEDLTRKFLNYSAPIIMISPEQSCLNSMCEAVVCMGHDYEGLPWWFPPHSVWHDHGMFSWYIATNWSVLQPLHDKSCAWNLRSKAGLSPSETWQRLHPAGGKLYIRVGSLSLGSLSKLVRCSHPLCLNP